MFGKLSKLLVLTSIALSTSCEVDRRSNAVTRAASVAELLGGGSTAGFSRAVSPRRFEFPADHAAHPDFQTEWWYFTGNLRTTDGRGFGYQLTFFRRALRPPTPEPESTSSWRSDQIYMAHFALTDVEAKRLHAFERFSRGGAGLAGATAEPMRVWVDNWVADGTDTAPMTFRLQADSNDDDDPVAIDLTLVATKPIVLQGDGGLSAKSADGDSSSFYYSLTRLATSGSIQVGTTSHLVAGTSWMDREWSTTLLSRDQVGWDWFALQLENGDDLMLFRLRHRDGDGGYGHAVRIDAAGNKQTLDPAADYTLNVTRTWTNRTGDVTYPAAFKLEIPTTGTDLRIEPLIADQELALSIRYWEGAVRVVGRDHGVTTTGYGYVELTGYGK